MAKKTTAAIEDFDDVFPHIGGFGPYQYIIFSLICFINCLFTFLYLGQFFMTLTPPHSCALPPGWGEEIQGALGANLSQAQLRSLSLPRNQKGTGFAECLRYDITVDQVDDSFQPNSSWPTTNCTYGWDYDFTLYYPSLSSQLNWVCAEDWKPPLAQSLFFIGSMIGIPIVGWLADAFGRIPLIVGCNLVAGIVGIGSSFSNSFVVFCVLRFIVGLAFDSNFLIIYILGLEYVSAPYRSVVANVPIMIFLTASMCALPWIAYFVHHWVLFSLIVHAPFLVCAALPWLAPESARWLLSKGKGEEALRIMKAAARMNKKGELGPDFETSFQTYAQKVSEHSSETVSWLDLLKTPTLRKRFILLSLMWVSIFLAYDGHVRNTESIGYNIFVSFTLMGAVELPADLLTIFSMEWLGRRHTTVWSLVLSGLMAIMVIFVEESATHQILGLAITGRFLITMAINVGQQYIIEILPTVGRAQGSGAIHTFGMGMAFVSPYIVYLSKFHHWLPYLLFGLISVAGGVTCLFLPETIGEKLPDSLQDGETFFQQQPFFYHPCKARADDAAEDVAPKYIRRPSQ